MKQPIYIYVFIITYYNIVYDYKIYIYTLISIFILNKLLVTSAALPDGRARAWAFVANKTWIGGVVSLTLRRRHGNAVCLSLRLSL